MSAVEMMVIMFHALCETTSNENFYDDTRGLSVSKAAVASKIARLSCVKSQKTHWQEIAERCRREGEDK